MKKIISIVIAVVLIFIIGILFFIPANQNLTILKNIEYPGNAIVRLLHDNRKLKKCLSENNVTGTDLKFKETLFHPEKELINGIEFLVNDDGNKILGTLEVVGMENTRCQILWKTNARLSENPFIRAINYFQFKSVSKKVISFMDELSSACNSMENIYDVAIEKIHIEESAMISSSKVLNHFPTTNEIYSEIDGIEKYISDNKGLANGSPMLNITTEDSIDFLMMAAVPTKQEIQGSTNYKLKKMMMGNMLRASYTGGPNGIENAKNQLRKYVEDYKKIPAAIPFEILVTNRIQVVDTSKWVTELYYPIFY